MSERSRVHLWVSYIGVSISALLLVLFSLSVRYEYGFEGRTVAVGFTSGSLFVDSDHVDNPLGWFYIDSRAPIVWRPGFARIQGAVSVYVPLWIPFLLLAVSSVSALLRPTPTPHGHCEKCGYNLAKLTSSKCPECGTPVAKPSKDAAITALLSGETLAYRMHRGIPIFGLLTLLALPYIFLTESGVLPWLFVPRNDKILEEPDGIIFVGFLFLGGLFLLAMGRMKGSLSEEGIFYRGILFATHIRWKDITHIRHAKKSIDIWICVNEKWVRLIDLNGRHGNFLSGMIACAQKYAPHVCVEENGPSRPFFPWKKM